MGEAPEWFRATSGRVTGVLGLAAAAGVLVLALLDPGRSRVPAVVAGAAFGAVVCWVALLRPRVGLTDTTLVLRSMLDTAHLPLAAIERLAVGQVLAVWVDGQRYVSPAVGKPVRKTFREVAGRSAPVPATADGEAPRVDKLAYADFVAFRIRQASADARAIQQIVPGSPEQAALAAQVRRERAVPEVVGLAATAVAFVATLLL